ncbi:hypothetical protein DOTSEDRAFT_163734 [Dothistroma septosporum NZE10]|uniref:Zn(2)-C6 fungal-type domain-containing protein n=1 Tax=Dothistroma septosporum (strain NZE10 / CBS 128990) TaxID=675120 RepID=N1Q145_DOTSN|nr:hypothetical protein DOTSEDRAFT_163734 [Dothistroma septosporum NZE10]
MDEGSNVGQNPALATPDSEKLNRKRQRQPRNSACQGCASLKMKCISTDHGKCERCNRMDRDCVPAVPKPRKRRTESGIAFGADQGIPLLDFAAASSSTAAPPPHHFDPARSAHSDEAERRSLLQQHDLSHTDSKTFVALFSRGLGNVAAVDDLLRGVDYNFVANSFTIFRQLQVHFPFVDLKPDADAISMVARRPMLTLAICTVAAATYPEAQSRLSQAFQYALSSKVILGTERSIDILAGVLVYLAWHHHYLPDQQVYQQLFLMAGIAADLGLYRPRLDALDPEGTLERDRTFVGCYYLSCGLAATGFDKPSPCRWTINFRRCANGVAYDGTLTTDRDLPGLLELAVAMDDMENSIRHELAAEQRLPIQFVDLHAKNTIQRLKALKREHPSLSGSLAYMAAMNHVYQRILRINDAPDSSVLIQAACSIKDYLEDLLARPPSLLHHSAILDWASLVESIVLMARITNRSTFAEGWESGALTSMLPCEQLLVSIYAHVSAAPQSDRLSPRNETLLRHLGCICEGIKRRILHNNGSDEVLNGLFNSFENGVLDAQFSEHLLSA